VEDGRDFAFDVRGDVVSEPELNQKLAARKLIPKSLLRFHF
jgi:hypothetical protein